MIEAGREWVKRRYALMQFGGKTADNYNFALSTMERYDPSPKTTEHFENAYICMMKDGMSQGTVRAIHYWLKAILKGIGSPMPDDLKPPRLAPRKSTTVDEVQLKRFLKAIKADTNIGPIIRFAVLTGARRGEIVALKWNDFDFVAGTVTIRRGFSRSRSGGSKEGEPKTRAGRRTLSLPPSLIKECMERYTGDFAYAFGSIDGRRNLNAMTNAVKKVLRRHGLGDFSLHDLRHAHATMLLRNKENPKAVSRRLGHADIRVTLGTYGHVMDQDDGALAAVAGRLVEE